jgi:hypothetical protein
MSLTTQLKDKNSPVSRWFNQWLDRHAAQRLVSQYNDRIQGVSPLLVQGANPALVGTAFDYLFRWTVDKLNPDHLVARIGAGLQDDLDNYYRIVYDGNNRPALRPNYSVSLAYYERVARGNTPLADPAEDKTIADVALLGKSIFEVWELKTIHKWYPNPSFVGSIDVGGADADFIADGVLYDIKCSRVKRPMLSEHLLQVLGYMLLDYHHRYELSGIGFYYARQKLRIRMPIDQVLSLFYNPDLTFLRQNLAGWLRG